MLWPHINTGFLHIQGNEFQLFVGKNVLELVQLFFSDIDDTDLGKPLGNPVADFLHGTFQVFHDGRNHPFPDRSRLISGKSCCWDT